jgi:hypothetical protein
MPIADCRKALKIMKKQLWFLLTLVSILSLIWISPGFSEPKENKLYSKKRDLKLLDAPYSSAKVVAKAAWNEELSILKEQDRWVKVSSQDGDGWVYSGNMSKEKIPEENQNDLPTKASAMNATAAGRGLSDKADEYADRHSLAEVADQVRWAEKLNREISKDEALDYLKSHKLGEYAEVK